MVTDVDRQQIRRRPVLSGLINEYPRRLIPENPQVTGSHRIFERHTHRLTSRLATASVPVKVTSDTAESLRDADASVDAVVFTLVLCSVNNPDRALGPAPRRRRGASQQRTGWRR